MIVIELLHQLSLGIVKRILKFSLDSKNKDRPCFIKKQDTFDLRLFEFTMNDDFKRDILPASRYKHWKGNQFLQYFFYVLPIALKSLVNTNVYKHHFKLIYIYSKLFNGGLSADELRFIEQLISSYLNDCERFYGKSIHVINMHLVNHLTDNYRELGPLGDHTAFLFEHMNGELSKKVSSPNHIQQQILNNSIFDFNFKLTNGKKNNLDIKIEPIGKKFKHDHQNECYSKIKINNKIFTSSLSKEKRRKRNCYILTKDNRFGKIIYFFKLNGCIYFKYNEIKITDKLFSVQEEERLELDHILLGRKTKNFYTSNCTNIKEKISFQKKFRSESSNLLNDNTGYLIRTNFFKFHN